MFQKSKISPQIKQKSQISPTNISKKSNIFIKWICPTNPNVFRKKMLESRPEDALVKLVKTVETVETEETEKTVETV